MGALLSRISNEETQVKITATTRTAYCEIWTIKNDNSKDYLKISRPNQWLHKDPLQVPTYEQTAIRANTWIEFASLYLYAALQVDQKMSSEGLFELMDASTGKNQLIDEKRKLKRLILRLVEMIILMKSIQIEKLSITERKTGQTRPKPETNLWENVLCAAHKITRHGTAQRTQIWRN